MTVKAYAIGAGVAIGLLVLTATWLVSRDESSPHFVAVPMGTGPEMQIGVSGTDNRNLSLAARWPFVVLAWTATTRVGDSAIYVTTSDDNGASFSTPRPIEAARTNAGSRPTLAPRITIEWAKAGPHGELVMPDFHLVWRVGFTPGGALRAVKSMDGGRSFLAEALDNERPVDATRQPPHTPPTDQIARAVGNTMAMHQRGTYDECGTVIVVWDDASDGASHVGMRRVVEDGQGIQTVLQTTTLSGASSAAQPDVASVLGGVLAAWTSNVAQRSVIIVRRIGLEAICQSRPASRTVGAGVPPRLLLQSGQISLAAKLHDLK